MIRKIIVAGLLLLFLAVLLVDAHIGGAWRDYPFEDLDNLADIHGEAEALMAKGLVGKVPKQFWTPNIRALKPKSLRIDNQGLWIAMEQVLAVENGVFVPSGQFVPQPGGDPSFKALGDGVYEYYVRG